MHTSQEELVRQLQQQDQSAIATLYDQYAAALYGVVLRIVQSPELAEQVLQDTFLKVWRNSLSFDPTKGRLFTWLLNIARNTAIDATRTAHFVRSQKTDSTDSLVHIPRTDGFNPDHVGLRESIGRLDEKYSTLIEMVYFQGYTQEEIAEATGIPLGTVKTRLRFALGELRRLFSDGKHLLLILCALSNQS